MLSTLIAPSAPTSSQPEALLERLKSGQLLVVDPNCQGGLIVVKSFYADFAGPGAAIGGGFDQHCTAVYGVGAVRVRSPRSRAEREESLYTRIAYAERLSTITHLAVPLRRGCLIVEQLCEWLLPNLAHRIPAELIGQLVGVEPTTVQLAWQSRKALAEDMPTLVSDRHELAS